MNMKHNKYIIGVMAAAGLLAASCTDFSDYNESYTSGSSESKLTLWENIQSNGNISQFAELVKKAGLDKELASSRYHTVWAPLNDTFDEDYSLYSKSDSATLAYKFVQSHIANFGYTASGAVSEKVHTLNEKSFDFAGNGSYTFDENVLQSVNNPSINGMLHTMTGSAKFLPNIYEYIFEAEGSDSVKNFFKKYEIKTINLSKSVEGAIVDGVQTYLDTVMDVSNTMTNRLRAYVQREDSNYTMMLPTDAAYEAAYNRVKKYYTYGASTRFQNLGAIDNSEKTQTVDAEYLGDSLTRYTIARSLFFNNNSTSNLWLQGRFNPRWPVDTIWTTSGTYYSNGPEVKELVYDSVRQSNGRVWMVDTLAHYSWDHWCPVITISPTSASSRALTQNCSPVAVRVNENELDKTKVGKNRWGEYEGFSYLDCLVTGDKVAPQLYFYIRGTLSTAYNVYVVTVPANIKEGSTETPKQYKLEVNLHYSSADGKSMLKKEFGREFITDSARVDTLMVGTIDFPIAYSQIPVSGADNVYPYIHIRSRRSTLRNANGEWDMFDNRLRIAAVILRPVEYDEYMHAFNKPEDE